MIAEERSLTVFCRQDGSRDWPLNSERRVVPAYRTFSVRVPVIIDFIKNSRRLLAHDTEAMGESRRYPYEVPVFGAQFQGEMLAERRRVRADVGDHVQDDAAQNADEFPLSGFHLEVHPANDARLRHGKIVLHEVSRKTVSSEGSLIKSLTEIASVVTETVKFDELWALDC